MKRGRPTRSAGNRRVALSSGEPTTARTAALVLLAVTPMIATLGYGATEMWAFIPLSLLVTLAAILWIVDGYQRGEITIPFDKLQVPFVGLILLGLIQLLPFGKTEVVAGVSISSGLSLDPYATRFFTIRLAILLVYFSIALVLLRRSEILKRTAAVFVIFGAFVAFAGILQRLMSPDAIYGMRPTPQAIPFGPFVNQHHFAAFMEMMFGLTLGLFFGGVTKPERRPLVLIAMLLMLIGAVMTGSRGGMLGIAVTVSFFFLVRSAVLGSRRSAGSEGVKWPIKAAGAGLAVVVVVGTVLFLEGADPLIRGIGAGSGGGDITSGRTHFWSIAWRIFLDHPLMGAGFDAFGAAFTKYDSWNGHFRVEQAHNDYLQTLADGGLLAFACVTAFIGMFVKRAAATVRHAKKPSIRGLALGALAGCVGILVHSFFDFPLRTPSNAMFFLILVVLAVSQASEKNEES